ncbi:hypothetical protein T11_4143 [Trichinella zimbabwensis]|uniref:Uncharacterized protein n=1 Tax=Trichinella zimbabwensis TaxID=268475 RepID=A0A0V1GPE5_9BILA|nr:hypothetical protein T11_4143 [Trichinella zimbabwensis]
MNGIDNKKSENYNEPGRTLHESFYAEISTNIRKQKVTDSNYICT